jgi:hypothetical protein
MISRQWSVPAQKETASFATAARRGGHIIRWTLEYVVFSEYNGILDLYVFKAINGM